MDSCPIPVDSCGFLRILVIPAGMCGGVKSTVHNAAITRNIIPPSIASLHHPDPPVAGPSNPWHRTIHVHRHAPTFAQLKKNSEEDPQILQKKRYRSETSNNLEESQDDQKRDPPHNSYQHIVHPTGDLFEDPCGQCIKQRVDCEKDLYVVACIRCFIGKNRCDYGSCYFRVLNPRRKGKGRGKARKTVKRDKLDVESEDEMPRHVSPPQRQPAKRIKSTAYVKDSDQMLESGFETSRLPPTSHSPSPRPCREAAKRADKALVAAVRLVNYEEDQLKKRTERENKSSCYTLFF